MARPTLATLLDAVAGEPRSSVEVFMSPRGRSVHIVTYDPRRQSMTFCNRRVNLLRDKQKSPEPETPLCGTCWRKWCRERRAELEVRR